MCPKHKARSEVYLKTSGLILRLTQLIVAFWRFFLQVALAGLNAGMKVVGVLSNDIKKERITCFANLYIKTTISELT